MFSDRSAPPKKPRLASIAAMLPFSQMAALPTCTSLQAGHNKVTPGCEREQSSLESTNSQEPKAEYNNRDGSGCISTAIRGVVHCSSSIRTAFSPTSCCSQPLVECRGWCCFCASTAATKISAISQHSAFVRLPYHYTTSGALQPRSTHATMLSAPAPPATRIGCSRSVTICVSSETQDTTVAVLSVPSGLRGMNFRRIMGLCRDF